MRNALFASLALVFTSLIGAAQAGENAVYFVAQIEVTNQETFFNGYGAQVAPLLQKAGAEVLTATPERVQLEGEWPGNWTVIIKFPSQESAMQWYRSDEYQAIRPLRLQSTSVNNIILAPRFAAPAQ